MIYLYWFIPPTSVKFCFIIISHQMNRMKIVVHINEGTGRKIKESAGCTSHFSNDGASNDVMTSHVDNPLES